MSKPPEPTIYHELNRLLRERPPFVLSDKLQDADIVRLYDFLEEVYALGLDTAAQTRITP